MRQSIGVAAVMPLKSVVLAVLLSMASLNAEARDYQIIDVG